MIKFNEDPNLPPPSLILDQYKLIDAEQFKSEMRASRLARQKMQINLTHSVGQLVKKDNQTDRFKRDSVDQQNQTIQLPITYSARGEKDNNSSYMNDTKSDFINTNRRQIQEVLYADVYSIHQSKISIKTPKKNKSKSSRGDPQQSSRFKENPVGQQMVNKFSQQANYKDETAKLVSNYQKLSFGRNKHAQVDYFKNKDRNITQIQFQQLFQQYRSNPLKQILKQTYKSSIKEIPTQKQKSQIHQMVTQQKHQANLPTSIKKDASRQCELCKLTKSHILKHKQKRLPPILKHNHRENSQHNIQQWQPQSWPTALEPHIMQINKSPARSDKRSYLSSEDKKQLSRKKTIEPNQNFIEQGYLKRQYLRQFQINGKQIEKQLTILTTPKRQKTEPNIQTQSVKSNAQIKNYSTTTPRRKIFSGINVVSSRPYIKILTQQNQSAGEQTSKAYTTNNSKWFRAKQKDKPTYKKIFATKNQLIHNNHGSKEKALSRQLNLNQIRQNLVNSRVRIFKSKEKEKEKQSQTANTSPHRQRSIIPGLRLLEMTAEVRKWYEQNRKEIVFQAERICSYDLIKRYMSENEISSRLFQLVVRMVQPRRWLLLMVDEVYERLKDRYLPVIQA